MLIYGINPKEVIEKHLVLIILLKKQIRKDLEDILRNIRMFIEDKVRNDEVNI